jgi:hypothetical protein
LKEKVVKTSGQDKAAVLQMLKAYAEIPATLGIAESREVPRFFDR